MKPIKSKAKTARYSLKKGYKSIIIALILTSLTGCGVIYPGEVGLKQKLGRIKPTPLAPGWHIHNIFLSRIIRFNTHIQPFSLQGEMPSKEGLEINFDITMLYHLNPDSVMSVFSRFGTNYQESIIKNLFASAIRESTIKYFAQDLNTERTEVATDIKNVMSASLGRYGFVIDQVFIKDLDLPRDVINPIKNKVLAEQKLKQQEVDNELRVQQQDDDISYQRKQEEFAIEEQKREAQRQIIEAEATKESQQIIDSSLTPKMLQYKGLDVTKALVKSGKVKMIITDGKSPLWLNTPADEGK